MIKPIAKRIAEWYADFRYDYNYGTGYWNFGDRVWFAMDLTMTGIEDGFRAIPRVIRWLMAAAAIAVVFVLQVPLRISEALLGSIDPLPATCNQPSLAALRASACPEPYRGRLIHAYAQIGPGSHHHSYLSLLWLRGFKPLGPFLGLVLSVSAVILLIRAAMRWFNRRQQRNHSA